MSQLNVGALVFKPDQFESISPKNKILCTSWLSLNGTLKEKFPIGGLV